MEHPLSEKTPLDSGRAEERAALRRTTGADLALIWNPRTAPRHEPLEALTGVDVRNAASLGPD